MHLQQLEMESGGKRTDRSGSLIEYSTVPIIWGAAGTNGQHAFFQHLHQSTQVTPCDFIAAACSEWDMPEHHEILLANCLAQSEGLLRGRSADVVLAELATQGIAGKAADRLATNRSFPGNRPSNTILLERLDARTLGALLALYEHKVFVQGVIWNINSFDQPGVELGKGLAGDVLRDIRNGYASPGHDQSTAAMIERIRMIRGRK